MSASGAEALILEGFSDPDDVAANFGNIDQDLAIERGWYADTTAFESLSDVAIACQFGRLQYVRADTNIRPITRLLNPHLHGRFLPLLTPNAATVLHVFGAEWRKHAEDLGVSADTRLAVTSLTRTAEYQQQLVAAGKFASSRQSSHTVGNAFDIDLGGYYVGQNEVGITAVSERSLDKQLRIAEAFVGGLGVRHQAILRLGAEHYDPRVEQATYLAQTALEQQGLIKGLIEMQDTPNRCLHVAVAPDHL